MPQPSERAEPSLAPQEKPVPGLLAGLAGLGYGLLRLADPQRVPSVPALAGPAVEG